MPRFKNRIGLSLLLILAGFYLREFYAKPISSPIYAAAVNEYRNRHHEKSLSLLSRAYRIDPNNTSVLTLMGWNYLKTGKTTQALESFRRAHRLAPSSPDTTLGYADTEISLGHYQDASELLGQESSDSVDVEMAWGSLYWLTGLNMDAARKFEQVLAMDPGNAEVKNYFKRAEAE